MTPSKVSLVADIGGTNTRVALAQGTVILAQTVHKFRNADHPGLAAVLKLYLRRQDDVDCDGACVAVAGPVRDGRATLTNLNWAIDRAMLAEVARAERVAILNDLQAQGHALDHLEKSGLRSVVAGQDGGPHAAKLVIGVGTGFNAAPVYNTETGRYVPPSEAGHGNLPVLDETDLRLSRFLADATGFASVEDVLSGRGLTHLYSWISQEAGERKDLSPVQVMDAVAMGRDPLARRTGQAFSRLLGCVAGNLALATLPFGGVFLAGGVSRAIAPYLGGFGFEAAFRDKGRFGSFMEQFSVSIVEDDFAALTGCASHLAGLS